MVVVAVGAENCDCWSPPTEMVRCSALTMPAVTEPCRPSGLPMASTVSPTCTASLSSQAA